MAFTDQELMEQIQNALIEPPDGGATWPSGLWNMEEVVSYMNQRQNKFLKDTHFQYGIANIPVEALIEEYDLPDDWINTIRVLWINTEGESVELGRSDTWEADHGIPTWSWEAGTPLLYYDGGIPISLILMPIPLEDGTVQIHYVPYAVELDGAGELLTLPDEFIHTIKYGTIADMLNKVGRGGDAPRAKYCEQRFQLGLQVAKMLVEGFK